MERQLDGMDVAERKALIYENLDILAFKKDRDEETFRHINTATELFGPFRQNKPEGWKASFDERNKVLKANVDRIFRDAYRVGSSDDNLVRPTTAVLEWLQHAGVIKSYNVMGADQEDYNS